METLEKLFKHIWKIDKLLHTLVGLVIFLGWITYINPILGYIEAGVGIVPVFIAGAFKEVYDEFFKRKKFRGKYGGDPWDFFATVIPALLAYLILLLY